MKPNESNCVSYIQFHHILDDLEALGETFLCTLPVSPAHNQGTITPMHNTKGYLKGFSPRQVLPVHETQQRIMAKQAAACMADLHTSKVRQGMLGRARQLSPRTSRNVHCTAGSYMTTRQQVQPNYDKQLYMAQAKCNCGVVQVQVFRTNVCNKTSKACIKPFSHVQILFCRMAESLWQVHQSKMSVSCRQS